MLFKKSSSLNGSPIFLVGKKNMNESLLIYLGILFIIKFIIDTIYQKRERAIKLIHSS